MLCDILGLSQTVFVFVRCRKQRKKEKQKTLGLCRERAVLYLLAANAKGWGQLQGAEVTSVEDQREVPGACDQVVVKTEDGQPQGADAGDAQGTVPHVSDY